MEVGVDDLPALARVHELGDAPELPTGGCPGAGEVVRSAGGTQAFHHPAVGLLSTHLMQLRMIDQPSLKVVIHHPSTAEDMRRLELLRAGASWGAVIDQSR